ncbi:hypothetical protein DHC50_13995 [Arenibacter sp. A80]|nr:hypothetical protein [Arenibacter sp. A80]RFT55786.1 hypothetical protein D0S24_13990 [Arenibacter sp. P308M17]
MTYRITLPISLIVPLSATLKQDSQISHFICLFGIIGSPNYGRYSNSAMDLVLNNTILLDHAD